ncbi:MAG: flippase [Candidatus Zixiibacteriota bacterium]
MGNNSSKYSLSLPLPGLIAYNTVFRVVTRILGALFSMATYAILARYFGAEIFGGFIIVVTYGVFFALAMDFGLYLTTVRDISKEDERAEEILASNAGLRMTAGIFLLFVLAVLASVLPYAKEVRWGLAIFALSVFIDSIANSYTPILQAKMRLDFIGIIDVVNRLVVFSLVYLLSRSGGEFLLVLSVFVVANLVNLALSLYFARRFVKIKFLYDLRAWGQTLKKSFPLWLVLAIGTIHFRVDTLILSFLKGSSDVGIYGLAFKVLELVLILPALFLASVFPLMSEYAKSRKEELSTLMQKSFEVLLMLSLPAIGGTLVLAPKLISFLGGEQYQPASLALKILILATLFSYLNGLFVHLIISLELQKRLLLICIVTVTVNVALNFILIPRYSYNGAAVATVISEAAGMFFSLLVAKSGYSFKLRFDFVPKTVLAVGLMSLGLILFNLNLFAHIALGVVIYITFLFVLRLITKEEILSFVR